jgi:signal transduction histidine kinase
LALPLRIGELTHGGDKNSSGDIRRALARELHDRVAQTLTTMLMDLENFKMEQLELGDQQGALRQIAALQESTRVALKNLRGVLYDLRGRTGIEEDFTRAVRGLLGGFHKTRFNVMFSVSQSWPSELPSEVAIDLLRIIEEALTNVRRHSGARVIEVALGTAFDGQLAVEVKDDGRGFESEAGHCEPGLGLVGMRERAFILGGRLEVVSVRGRGTTVRAIVPMEQLV